VIETMVSSNVIPRLRSVLLFIYQLRMMESREVPETDTSAVL